MAHTDNPIQPGHCEAAVTLILPFTVLCSCYLLEGGGDDEICSQTDSLSSPHPYTSSELVKEPKFLQMDDDCELRIELVSAGGMHCKLTLSFCIAQIIGDHNSPVQQERACSIHGDEVSCELTRKVVVLHLLPGHSPCSGLPGMQSERCVITAKAQTAFISSTAFICTNMHKLY